MEKMSKSPLVLRSKTIRCPSGEKSGRKSLIVAEPVVIARWPLPFGFMT